MDIILVGIHEKLYMISFDFQYFNKIQCFCFEEQRLNPNEEVDMPVFFYIDPDFLDDPFLEKVDTINLSYTFFESKPGFVLPSVARQKYKLVSQAIIMLSLHLFFRILLRFMDSKFNSKSKSKMKLLHYLFFTFISLFPMDGM